MKVNFIIYKHLPKGGRQLEVELNRLRELDWDNSINEAKRQLSHVWGSYCLLKNRLPGVELSARFCRNAINVIDTDGLREAHDFDPIRHFTVTIRRDVRPFPYSHLEIIQNQAYAGPGTVYIPYWPQPGLLPRRESRSVVENVCYAGDPKNLWGDQRTIEETLNRVGLNFIIRPKFSEWNDLRDVDIMIGIRTLDKKKHNHKPASKMINSWHANIPFVGGYDSAFTQCGSVGKDYLRVSNKKELLEALSLLKTDHKTYKDLVENGKCAVREFTIDAISQRWADVLNDVAWPMYERWREHGEIRRLSDIVSKSRYIVFEKTPMQVLPRVLHKVRRDD